MSIDMRRRSSGAVAVLLEVINPAHASYLTCTHDAHQRPTGPLHKEGTSLLSTSCFSCVAPAGRPFHSFRFRCALPSAHTTTDYYSTVPFPLMNHFLPPSSAIRTLVFIGGSCGLLLQSACMGVGTRTAGEPLLGWEVLQHDSGIIFCTSLAALPSHQLLKTSVAAFVAALFLFLRDFLLSLSRSLHIATSPPRQIS